jgi:hypothetical protein
MTERVLWAIQAQVREARSVLASHDAHAGARLLREAEATAGLVSSDLVPGSVFQAVVEVRNELGCYLLAAEQMEQAGVERGAVVGVLLRGAETAGGILDRLPGAVTV